MSFPEREITESASSKGFPGPPSILNGGRSLARCNLRWMCLTVLLTPQETCKPETRSFYTGLLLTGLASFPGGVVCLVLSSRHPGLILKNLPQHPHKSEQGLKTVSNRNLIVPHPGRWVMSLLAGVWEQRSLSSQPRLCVEVGPCLVCGPGL